MLIFNAFWLLGAFDERNSEYETASGGLSQEVRSVGVPSNSERVPPSTKKRVSRLQNKTDLRNTDKDRITSLGWAALEGSLEVFEWLLLDYGHDDQELSRVSWRQ